MIVLEECFFVSLIEISMWNAVCRHTRFRRVRFAVYNLDEFIFLNVAAIGNVSYLP